MQIDSTRVHEALNQIAIKLHNCELDGLSCVAAMRKALCDIEADAALRRSRDVYRCVIERLENG
jgi:hypothetical protein